jgi:DNA-binding CsgD family transcriptional regulator
MPPVTTRLTEVEEAVDELRQAGYSYGDIARVLRISRFTARDHVKRIERKRAIAAERQELFEHQARSVPPR